jgi:hypothetical protein
MGLSHSPSIVMDGLVSYWDASNTRSYSGSGDWLDMSSFGYNLLVRNSPTFVKSGGLGYFTLNGTNQDFYLASYTLTFTSITYNLWVWRNGTQSNYAGLVMNRGNATGFIYPSPATSFGYIWQGDGNTYTYFSGVQTANQTWAMATLTVTATEAKWYINGILQHTRVNGHSSSTFANLYVGSDPQDGNRYYNGRISMVQIYNRALTASEILQNYDATKTRFGLS